MMNFIRLSLDSYPVKYYKRTYKVTNILKVNGIGLRKWDCEKIKNFISKFDVTCMIYLIDNEDMIYIEFYRKKDCTFVYKFFNDTLPTGSTLSTSDVSAEYANIKYEINNNSCTVYSCDYSCLLKHKDYITIINNVLDKNLSDEILENYKNEKWLMYTKNDEINVGYYFCRNIPNKIYKSYCISKLDSFFSLEFLERITKIFNNRQPNQITILNCHLKKAIEYVIESSYIFDEEIAFLVLGNELPMSFLDIRNKEKLNLVIESNTLLRIKGKLRHEIIFGIPKKKKIQMQDKLMDRKNSYLVIFRFIREDNIKNFVTQKIKNQIPQNERQEKDCVPINVNEYTSEKLEKMYVLDVYNQIALHFGHTRYKSWKNVENIINEEKEGNIILDVGCGNGKNLSESSKYFYIGLDFSLYLLMLARKKMNTDLLLANCINIPLRSNLADLCISIAVIHHLGTHEKRKQAVKEMVRCTKIGGRILIYVWAYEQQENVVGNRKFDSQDIFVPWYFQQQYKTEGYDDDAEGEGEEEPEKENEKEKEESHKFKPVKKDLVKLERYYHVFKKEELYELCNSIEEVKVEKFYFDCNNWGIILRKIF
ncbi:methyltransferase, putative [Plasmodium sp. gorilla clade G1]|nr:methyltransferase, putative [Plasmodium sp. gorilla clade G1]